MIRDNALAVSGLLVREIGGASVKPYQPEGLYRHLNFPPRTYQADAGSKQYRRGVYTHWQRQFLHPAMQAFDAPAREECTAERPRSNTPLAALVLLNDPSYIEAARVLATHALSQLDLTNLIGNATFHDPEITTRIAQYELAFQMQTSVPELMDISDEPQHVLDMYGTQGADGSFGSNCLLARRLAERGVRFIQLYHRGWDHHGSIKQGSETTGKLVDQGTAALVKDLKQRGMLEDTLVIWGGEFGRTPMAQGSGRDHHIKGFSLWMAGGGIRSGFRYGATDELGYAAVENPMHVNDLHATMLYLFGIDHLRLTYRFQVRDFRLTDVSGQVVEPLLA